MESFRFKEGEKKFIRTFESIYEKEPSFKEKKSEEKVIITLETIKKEIEGLPEVKSETEFHPQVPINQATNILAQAIQIAIEEDPAEAFKFISSTNNPYLIDAFHDVLIGHFLDLLKKTGKINE